jgi:hypothetical protein
MSTSPKRASALAEELLRSSVLLLRRRPYLGHARVYQPWRHHRPGHPLRCVAVSQELLSANERAGFFSGACKSVA